MSFFSIVMVAFFFLLGKALFGLAMFGFTMVAIALLYIVTNWKDFWKK